MTAQALVDALFSDITTEHPELVRAAVEQWAAVGPLLVARTLQEATLLAQRDPDEIDNIGPMFALELFGHLRDPQAWPAVHALCTLPAEAADYHLAGIAMSSLGQILYRTSGGQFEPMAAMLRDSAVHALVREAALTGLRYAVADGVIERRALLDLLVSLMSAPENAEQLTDDLPDILCEVLLDLRPHEYAAELTALAQTGVLDGLDDEELLEQMLSEDPDHVEKVLQGLRHARASFEPADVVERMSSWLPEVDTPGNSDIGNWTGQPASLGPAALISKTERAQRKRKAKIAKQTRKANRKRK